MKNCFFFSTCKEFPFNIIDRCSLSSDDNLKPIWLTTDVRKCCFQRLFHYNTFWCYPSHIKRVLKKWFFTTIHFMSYSCVKIPLVNSIDDWWTLSTCFLLERVLFAVQKVRWCELDLGFFLHLWIDHVIWTFNWLYRDVEKRPQYWPIITCYLDSDLPVQNTCWNKRRKKTCWKCTANDIMVEFLWLCRVIRCLAT